jgi:hypothetical protein
MLALLCASFLALPLYPLNPTVEDTLSAQSLRFGFGFNGPNNYASVSPEFNLKYELLIQHPVVVRGGVDYRPTFMNSKVHPDGVLHTVTFSADIIYYRGTDDMTAYIGIGPTLSVYDMAMDKAAADSMYTYHNVTDVRVRTSPGYRISLGLLYRRVYALEISFAQSKPKFIYRTDLPDGGYVENAIFTKVGDIRVIVGYLFRFG